MKLSDSYMQYLLSCDSKYFSLHSEVGQEGEFISYERLSPDITVCIKVLVHFCNDESVELREMIEFVPSDELLFYKKLNRLNIENSGVVFIFESCLLTCQLVLSKNDIDGDISNIIVGLLKLDRIVDSELVNFKL